MAKTARLNELNALLNLDKTRRGGAAKIIRRQRTLKNHSGNVEYLHCRCGRKLENVPGM